MALARVLDESEFGDVVVRKNVAQVFLFFLPGLASGLKQIALEDEKVGHKIPQVNIRSDAVQQFRFILEVYNTYISENIPQYM